MTVSEARFERVMVISYCPWFPPSRPAAKASGGEVTRSNHKHNKTLNYGNYLKLCCIAAMHLKQRGSAAQVYSVSASHLTQVRSRVPSLREARRQHRRRELDDSYLLIPANGCLPPLLLCQHKLMEVGHVRLFPRNVS